MMLDVVDSYPLILFFEGYTYRSDGLLTLKYSKDTEFIKKAMTETEKIADGIILNLINHEMTDFEKELAVHDYIVNNCSYDVEYYSAGTVRPESYSAYGVLVNKTAVCEGYAKAMKLLLNRAGIESLVITGKSKSYNHAWNLINLENNWYHVDVTWDDPVINGGQEILQHTYFNLSDKAISIDHEWNEHEYPECVSKDYYYYNYNKLIVYSPQELISFMNKNRQKGNTFVTVKFDDYNINSYNIEILIQESIFGIGRKVTYSIDEDYGIINIWLDGDEI